MGRRMVTNGEIGPVQRVMRYHQFWTEHGVHSPPLRDEVPLLLEVAHAAWHMLDEGGDYPDDEGLRVVSALDWQRLSDALDAAGWSPDARANARSTGERMTASRDVEAPSMNGGTGQ